MNEVYVTIDVEDWFQVENLRPAFPRETWDRQEWRVHRNVERLLELLADHRARATFFVLGSVADAFPDLVRRIADEGHEVASHGYNHQLLYSMNQQELREDLTRSKKLLEDLTGREVTGYRAPSFSISDGIIEHIRAAGYRYDSSYNDFGSHGRYGSIDMERWELICQGVWRCNGTPFYEIPIQNLKFMGLNIPWGGGGYFRMLPWRLFKKGIENITAHKPYIFYFHPWEIDPDQPVIKELPAGSRFKHYVNLSKSEARFKELLKTFEPMKVLSQLVEER
ncbi:MAG: XrtA system polysaccharide deacetylase [Balneolaceae bacterium]|nr:XrtA system polysaccharide deacetylase [Balneolaceae bacterium]